MAWGNQTWGYLRWGELGDVFVNVENPNNVPWGGNTWGFGEWNNGEAMSMSLNNSGITITNEINVGWGSDAWGVETWGESGNLHAVTGIAMTMAEGLSGASINGDSNLTLSGNSATLATGTVDAFSAFVAEPSGLAMTMNQTFDPEIVNVTGQAMTAALGTAVGDNITFAEVNSKIPGYWGYKSTWGTLAWGNGQTELLAMAMAEGLDGADPAPDATLTGIQMSISLAIPGQNNFDITGDANTGAGDTTMAWGDATWGNSRWNNGQFIADPNYGQTMALTLGNESVDLNTPVDVTGFALTAALNSVANVETTNVVFPSGNALTMSLGTGTNTLIWNAVDTGSAPTTPPGWKEVPTNAA